MKPHTNHKPNLFIVGAPKAGTTSLYHNLKQHPEIFMSTPKEIHHFCTDLIEEGIEFHNHDANKFTLNVCQDRKQYLDFFAEGVEEKIRGEGSVFYLYSQSAPQNIHQFNPEAKIIILVREPASFLHSLHAQLHYSANDPCADFEKALELESSRRAGKNLPQTTPWPSMLYYSQYPQFTKFIKNYTDVFPPEQIKILLLDQLKEKPLKTMKAVFQFLDVDPDFEPKITVANLHKVERIQIKHKAKIKQWLTRYLPMSLRNLIAKIYCTLNRKPQKRAKMDPELERKLKLQYRKEVEKLSKLFDQDLIKKWHYPEATSDKS